MLEAAGHYWYNKVETRMEGKMDLKIKIERETGKVSFLMKRPGFKDGFKSLDPDFAVLEIRRIINSEMNQRENFEEKLIRNLENVSNLVYTNVSLLNKKPHEFRVRLNQLSKKTGIKYKTKFRCSKMYIIRLN